jgi:hypothetical protein
MRRFIIPQKDLAALVSEVAKKGGKIAYQARVWGTSMAPSIGHGDRIDVRTLGEDQVAQDDVVVYSLENGRHVAHRISDTPPHPGGDVVTRSDVPGSPLETVNLNSVIGRVERSKSIWGASSSSTVARAIQRWLITPSVHRGHAIINAIRRIVSF